jgi:hypothetical protein
MARELVTAYTNSLVAGNSGAGVSVTLIQKPTARNRIRSGLPLLGGLGGAVVGSMLFLAKVLFRTVWPKRAA